MELKTPVQERTEASLNSWPMWVGTLGPYGNTSPYA